MSNSSFLGRLLKSLREKRKKKWAEHLSHLNVPIGPA